MRTSAAFFSLEWSQVKRPPADTPDAPDPSEYDADISWQNRVLVFIADLRGALSSGELHDAIVRKLPVMLGVEQLWIETNIGGRRKVIVAPELSPGIAHPLTDAPGEWATFPLRTGDTVLGLIGIPIGDRPLSAASKRALTLLAPVLADRLQTAHAIEQLREQSTVDSVTGCSTRPDGLERLRAELKRAQRSSQQVAVLMLDLDFFKSVNDRYGHQSGDAVLANIGHTIMQTLRVSDVRARWGGEEFLVALPESGLDQARRVAAALSRKIAGTVTECDAARIQLTTSIGITIAMPGEEDVDSVLARADAALYRAKADGRNCIRVVLADLDDGSSGSSEARRSPGTLPFRDRRDPSQLDRRHPPGPGRRATDAPRSKRASATDSSAADVARVRATLA